MYRKEFKIQDVLTWQPQREIDPLKINALKKDDRPIYPFYGQATNNNGIISYLHLSDSVLNNPEGRPTILVHSNNGNIVYLETPFYLKDGHGATSVLQSEYLTENTALYIISAIKKAISKVTDWNDKATKVMLKNTVIMLPVDENGAVDYEAMEEQIMVCKQRANSVKTRFLEKENLDSTRMRTEEKLANNKREYNYYQVSDLFLIRPTKTYGLTNDILYKTHGKTPVVCNSSTNNGIGGYVDLSPTEKGGIITFSDTTTGADTIFYQPYDFIGYSHVQGMYPIEKDKWTENTLIYFAVALKKATGSWFDWTTKFNRDICSALSVELPVNSSGEIDYLYMETFIDRLKKKYTARIL